jgi:hypothetical protein
MVAAFQQHAGHESVVGQHRKPPALPLLQWRSKRHARQRRYKRPQAVL